LPGVACLVSNGNDLSGRVSPTMQARQILKRHKLPRLVLVCCITRFAACVVKGWQVATGNGASCPWQQHDVHVKTWWPNLVAPYPTDNLSTTTSKDLQSYCYQSLGILSFSVIPSELWDKLSQSWHFLIRSDCTNNCSSPYLVFTVNHFRNLCIGTWDNTESLFK